ncbi:MAG: molybdenum ABC transporter ATP-binding protein [Burkholderiaceae bacterium]
MSSEPTRVSTARPASSTPADEARIVLRARVRHDDFLLDLDLSLPGRGVTGLFGHSGSGKTTCLRLMAGLIKADSGYLCVNGDVWLDTDHRIDLPTHQRALGYVFQEPSLFAHLNVLRNLQYGQKRVAASQHRVDMSHMTALLGIDHLLTRMPDSLSGGERQRVGIARALATSPRLLLMDEPLAALDLKRKREILPYLQRLHDELDIPVIYVSHSPDEMARLADHLVVLDAGRAVASGPVAHTLARLDLPASRTDDATAMIPATACEYDVQYGLLTVELQAPEGGTPGRLRLVHPPVAPRSSVRLAVQARDVSLALHDQDASSILNRLAARVQAIAPAEDPNHVIVRLDAAGSPLLARITRFSCDRLALEPGMHLWAQIKAVSLLQ